MGIKAFFESDKRNKKRFHRRDDLVLVGTVKSLNQFEVCLSDCFYYIPLKHLIPGAFYTRGQLKAIKYVSMYQSRNLFGERAGIRILGEVESVSVVKRCEIRELPKESKSLCVLFRIKGWSVLSEPIELAETPIYPFGIFTFQNFKASRDTTELFLESSEEREFYRLLKRMTTDVNFKSFEFFGFDFVDYNDTLVITKNGECYLQLPMEVIREMPCSGFETVKEAMRNQ
ncbi:MAG: hypothetical protein E7614_08595 [Ruminococcaceae bacterium]|nr:hypothetical protein [Oscillospiraceae bacterium]